MTTYILIHTHQFGMSHAIFQSERSLVGHYEGRGVGNEDIPENELITEIGTQLGLLIEFNLPEFVDINELDLTTIQTIE